MVTRIIETSETLMMGAMTRKYIATAMATTAITDDDAGEPERQARAR